MNSTNSVKKNKIIYKDSWALTHYLLCERQRLYNCTTDTAHREDSNIYYNSCFSGLSKFNEFREFFTILLESRS